MTKSKSTFQSHVFNSNSLVDEIWILYFFAAKEDFQNKMKKIVFLENKPKKEFWFHSIQTKKVYIMDSEEQEENVFFHSATESILRIRIRDKFCRLKLKAYF